MTNFESYSCSNLLKYLDGCYANSTDSTNYASYLLTMKEATSVKKLINIYNEVLWKFILSYTAMNDIELVPNTWYDINTIPYKAKDYWTELNTYLNQHIKRLYFTNEYTDELAFACIANLREAPNCVSIREKIVNNSSENVKSNIGKLVASFDVVNDAPNHLSPYNIGTNGSKEYRIKYVENVKYLISLGFIRSIKDKTFEKKAGISYFPDNKSIWMFILIIIILIPIAIFVGPLIGKAIFSFFCLLALIKMLTKSR